MKQTVYIASPESQQIHVWNLNHEGALTLTQVVDVPGQVQPMVVSPDKRYLYVGVRPEFRVLAYRIAPDDGALTFAAESALPGSPTHISTDHQGQFVFVGSYNAGNVSVTRLEDGLPVGVVDGRLPFRQYLTGQPYAVGSGIKAGSHLPVYGQR